MSEYQYYEFQTADRRLSSKEMQELRSYSTRAVITPTSFSNESVSLRRITAFFFRCHSRARNTCSCWTPEPVGWCTMRRSGQCWGRQSDAAVSRGPRYNWLLDMRNLRVNAEPRGLGVPAKREIGK